MSSLRNTRLNRSLIWRVAVLQKTSARCTAAAACARSSGDLLVRSICARAQAQLKENVDAEEIDKNYKIPQHVIDGLAELGCMGIKIPQEYGGLGFSQTIYNRAVSLVSGYDGSISVLLSAHQSIGVPQPLKLFGTPEQKKKYLPRLAKGQISAFALTEMDVGSDPARMSTTAKLTDDGEAYILNGEKLWCTNGTIADIIVVMARTGERSITAFIVEADWPGVEVTHRCHFGECERTYLAFGEARLVLRVQHSVGVFGDGTDNAYVF